MTRSSFFAGVARRPITVGGTPAFSPLFIESAALLGTLHTARTAAVVDLLPRGRYRPIEVLPGRAVVGIFAAEYRQTDIGPYNEVGLGLLVSLGRPRGAARPGGMLSTLTQALVRRDVGVFVADLPVTTELARVGGVEWFNFPKYVADIAFRDTADHRIATVREGRSMDLVVELQGWRPRRSRLAQWAPRLLAGPERLRIQTLSEIGGRAFGARFELRLADASLGLGVGAALRLGPHPRAAAYRSLDLSRPLLTLFAPECEGILHEPVALAADPATEGART
jgi:hypothetical protein